MNEHELAGQIAVILSEVRAVRADVDALRSEVRENDKRLRADLAIAVSRQNSAIVDTKKKVVALPNLSSRWRVGSLR